MISWEVRELELKRWNDEIETLSDMIERSDPTLRPEATRLRELAKSIRDLTYNNI